MRDLPSIRAAFTHGRREVRHVAQNLSRIFSLIIEIPGPHTEITGLGIERFTEGRRWSPSRVRDVCRFNIPFVTRHSTFSNRSRNFYFITKSTRLHQRVTRQGSPPSALLIFLLLSLGISGSSQKQPPRDWDPLVKQTYSVWVDTEKGRRKWHLSEAVALGAPNPRLTDV
jgi:hypothetical protein